MSTPENGIPQEPGKDVEVEWTGGDPDALPETLPLGNVLPPARRIFETEHRTKKSIEAVVVVVCPNTSFGAAAAAAGGDVSVDD